jgi:Flp pilus assembly protein TadD
MSPKEPGYYNNLGAVLSKNGMNEEAITMFKRAIEINPKDPVYLENLTRLYLSLGKHEEPISFYKKLIDLDPSVADYYNNLGVIYKRAKQPDDAIQSFQKAVALKPENPIYTHNLADVYADKGQFAEARQTLQTFTQAYPNHGYINIHLLLANLYSKNADWKKVASECEQAVKIDEKSIAAYKLLGITYYTMNQYELAEKTVNKYLTLNPNDQEAQALLVKISNKIKGNL